MAARKVGRVNKERKEREIGNSKELMIEKQNKNGIEREKQSKKRSFKGQDKKLDEQIRDELKEVKIELKKLKEEWDRKLKDR